MSKFLGNHLERREKLALLWCCAPCAGNCCRVQCSRVSGCDSAASWKRPSIAVRAWAIMSGATLPDAAMSSRTERSAPLRRVTRSGFQLSARWQLVALQMGQLQRFFLRVLAPSMLLGQAQLDGSA